jgi:hypothetical protein
VAPKHRLRLIHLYTKRDQGIPMLSVARTYRELAASLVLRARQAETAEERDSCIHHALRYHQLAYAIEMSARRGERSVLRVLHGGKVVSGTQMGGLHTVVPADPKQGIP